MSGLPDGEGVEVTYGGLRERESCCKQVSTGSCCWRCRPTEWSGVVNSLLKAHCALVALCASDAHEKRHTGSGQCVVTLESPLLCSALLSVLAEASGCPATVLVPVK